MNDEALLEPLPVRRAQRALRKLSTSTRPVVYGGNRIELLRSGDEYFPRLLAAIEAAKQSIHIETYIFELDDIGQKRQRCAGGRGTARRLGPSTDRWVRLASCRRPIDCELRPKGAKVIVFRRARWWRFERRLLRRLHRKISLFDDRLAFVGGINIIDDYHHPDPEPVRAKLGPRFDFAVACEGPLVAADRVYA